MCKLRFITELVRVTVVLSSRVTDVAGSIFQVIFVIWETFFFQRTNIWDFLLEYILGWMSCNHFHCLVTTADSLKLIQ